MGCLDELEDIVREEAGEALLEAVPQDVFRDLADLLGTVNSGHLNTATTVKKRERARQRATFGESARDKQNGTRSHRAERTQNAS